MADIKTDIQDIILEAQAEVTEFLREFVKDLLQSDADQAVQDIWSKLPDEQKEQFKQQHPQQYAEIRKRILAKETT